MTDEQRRRKAVRIYQELTGQEPQPESGAQSDPFCWYRVTLDITDEWVTVYSDGEDCPGPDWKPLYTAPHSEMGTQGAAKVPEGWKLVPVEPTQDMTREGYRALQEPSLTISMSDLYRSMLAAAPKPD